MNAVRSFGPPPTLGISVALRGEYGYFLELHNMETHQTLNALFAIIYSINKVQQFILFAQEKSFHDFDIGSQLVGMASTGRRLCRSKDHGNKNILS